jgi:hypothetical protein
MLGGRQRRFCSRSCKNRDTNTRHQSYASQQARGLRRKCQLIVEAGGRCTRCGYRRNLAALTWHHIEPASKSFNLDVRALSNRSSAEIQSEVGKCVLLCANCHAEEHFPGLTASAMGLENIRGRRRGR